jgi:cobalt-zinc-cadmium efflux system membrane fusion protein
LLVLLAACGGTATDSHDEHGDTHDAHGDAHGEHGDEHGAEESHAPESDAFHESAAEAGSIALDGVRGVSFAEVAGPVEEGVWYPGEAIPDADERSMLTAPVAGVVTAIRVAPGREVAQGAALLVLRSPELAELAAKVLETRALREQAATEVAREERLAAADAGAARELEAARAALRVAEAQASAAALALEARGVPFDVARATLQVRAPFGGRVADYDVLVGEAVAAGQKLGLFETANATVVQLELPLPGPSTWKQGAETVVRRGDGKSWPAVVEGLPASLTPATRRLTYRLRLVGDEPPYPGTPLEARVPLPPGIVVPQDAVQQIEGQWGVFAVEDEVARFHPIRRGPELGGDVIVLEGLEPGQRIATEGAYLLKALALKRAGGGAAHAH